MKKDMQNAMLCGVCSGLGKHSGIDPVLLRVGFAVTTLLGFGLPVIAYVVLAIVMPNE